MVFIVIIKKSNTVENDQNWSDSDSAYNTQPLVFPNPTVGGDWGLMRGWAMCTASTAGQVVLVGALTVPVRVYYSGALAQLTVPVGGIQINHYSEA